MGSGIASCDVAVLLYLRAHLRAGGYRDALGPRNLGCRSIEVRPLDSEPLSLSGGRRTGLAPSCPAQVVYLAEEAWGHGLRQHSPPRTLTQVGPWGEQGGTLLQAAAPGQQGEELLNTNWGPGGWVVVITLDWDVTQRGQGTC